MCRLLLLVFPAQFPASFTIETNMHFPCSLSPLASGCWEFPPSWLLSFCTTRADECTDSVLPQNLPIFFFYTWAKILKRIY